LKCGYPSTERTVPASRRGRLILRAYHRYINLEYVWPRAGTIWRTPHRGELIGWAGISGAIAIGTRIGPCERVIIMSLPLKIYRSKGKFLARTITVSQTICYSALRNYSAVIGRRVEVPGAGGNRRTLKVQIFCPSIKIVRLNVWSLVSLQPGDEIRRNTLVPAESDLADLARSAPLRQASRF
jgi:hypothetical protein